MLLVILFVIPLVVVWVPVLIGQWYGHYHHRKSASIASEPVGLVVTAAFGLSAFMLAFTFQIASSRFEKRKELSLDEVTNIRTAYLRAGLLPEPFRSGTKKLMVEYVDLRVDVVHHPGHLTTALSRSQAILDSCWNYAEALAAEDRSSEIYSLYTGTSNDLVDDYNHRITVGIEYRIPVPILWILFFITFLSMLMLGYQFGTSGRKTFGMPLLLAIIFAVVMFLILVLDKPETGLIKINHKPLFRLQEQLHKMQQDVSK